MNFTLKKTSKNEERLFLFSLFFNFALPSLSFDFLSLVLFLSSVSERAWRDTSGLGSSRAAAAERRRKGQQEESFSSLLFHRVPMSAAAQPDARAVRLLREVVGCEPDNLPPYNVSEILVTILVPALALREKPWLELSERERPLPAFVVVVVGRRQSIRAPLFEKNGRTAPEFRFPSLLALSFLSHTLPFYPTNSLTRTLSHTQQEEEVRLVIEECHEHWGLMQQIFEYGRPFFPFSIPDLDLLASSSASLQKKKSTNNSQ